MLPNKFFISKLIKLQYSQLKNINKYILLLLEFGCTAVKYIQLIKMSVVGFHRVTIIRNYKILHQGNNKLFTYYSEYLIYGQLKMLVFYVIYLMIIESRNI